LGAPIIRIQELQFLAGQWALFVARLVTCEKVICRRNHSKEMTTGRNKYRTWLSNVMESMWLL
jgi:hypothetical protein